jgi:hypothetical protein
MDVESQIAQVYILFHQKLHLHFGLPVLSILHQDLLLNLIPVYFIVHNCIFKKFIQLQLVLIHLIPFINKSAPEFIKGMNIHGLFIL